MKSYLPGDILTKVDRMSMANSLEARVPLLDHRLVEFACGLPVDLRMRAGTGKYLLKRALQGRIPAELLTRPKQGFGVPLEAWFSGSIRGFFRDQLGDGRRLEGLGIARPAVGRLQQLFEETGRRDYCDRLWALVVLDRSRPASLRSQRMSAARPSVVLMGDTLNFGGTEGQFVELACGLDRTPLGPGRRVHPGRGATPRPARRGRDSGLELRPRIVQVAAIPGGGAGRWRAGCARARSGSSTASTSTATCWESPPRAWPEFPSSSRASAIWAICAHLSSSACSAPCCFSRLTFWSIRTRPRSVSRIRGRPGRDASRSSTTGWISPGSGLRARPSRRDQGSRLPVLANLRPEKGILQVVEAAAVVKRTAPQVHFDIWGEGAAQRRDRGADPSSRPRRHGESPGVDPDP